MRAILVFDSETTGLPEWSKPSDDPSQPHITQLCADLCDEETGDTISSFSVIIKPDGWVIPFDLEILTGITTEHANKYGVPISMALDMLMALHAKAYLRVAHNESFDMRMVRIEMKRDTCISDAFADAWKAAPAFCTQGQSTKIINLPPTEKMLAKNKRGPKPPNLAEAYEFFARTKLLGAHNAAVDVMACKRIYLGIQAHIKRYPAA